MNHWAFVTAAYVVAIGATAVLLAWSWLSMRKAEADVDAVKRR